VITTRSAALVLVTAVLLGATAGCSSGTQAEPTPATSTPAAPPTPIPAPTTAGGVSVTSTPVASALPMPTGTPGRPRGITTTAVDTTSADAVATAFVATTFSYDSATDVSEFDAQVRSAVHATPAFAAELTTPLARTGSTVFTTLASHQGFTTVALATNADDGQPADALRSAARSYRVTVTGQGTAGWSAKVDTATVYVMLVRAGASAPWQVTSVSFGLGR
jgi:hypothetical protein